MIIEDKPNHGTIEQISELVDYMLEENQEIKNVVFDLYGTLVDIHTDENAKNFWKKFAKLLRKNGIHYEWKQVRGLYYNLCDYYTKKLQRELASEDGSGDVAERRENDATKRSENDAIARKVEIDISDVFYDLCRVMRPDITREESDKYGYAFRTMSRSKLRLFDATLPMLKSLKERGYGVYLLSNAQAIFTLPELEQLGIIPCFDYMAISSDAGVKKPDVAFAQYLFDKCNLKAEDCLMVGNEFQSDAAIAINSGMKYVYVRSGQTVY